MPKNYDETASGKVMDELKHGKLKNGTSGKKVTAANRPLPSDYPKLAGLEPSTACPAPKILAVLTLPCPT